MVELEEEEMVAFKVSLDKMLLHMALLVVDQELEVLLAVVMVNKV
jgi:hypothetical protein